MDKNLERAFDFHIERIDAETYLAGGKEMTYTELIQWFKDRLLEK